jgi:peptidoglycan/xylan/chitin deacetylase (PgdA/CDA1 family)
VCEPVRPTIRRRDLLAAAGGLVVAACGGGAVRSSPGRRPGPPVATTATAGTAPSPSAAGTPAAGTPAPGGTRPATARVAPAPVILARSHVPVLCFHQVRDWAAGDSPAARSIITPPQRFAIQMDALARAGYATITPDELLDYLQYGTGLPTRPVMLSFDDASEGQYTHALPVLLRHRFTATFFVMTVVLDKPRWLSRAQVRDLHRRGMTIGAHTWDHHPVPGYSGQDWRVQLVEPARELARITGAPVGLFAYPYGLWSQAALPHLRAAGYRAAFQLGQRQDPRQPLLTIRRMIAPSGWAGPTLLRQIQADF